MNASANSAQTEKTRFDRSLGALQGVALGDALGMPTQTLSGDDIRREYGQITDFIAPISTHPVAKGLRAAAITDDTEQTLLLAEHIISTNGAVEPDSWAKLLIAWEAGVKERGLHDLLGPSTKRALRRLFDGAPVSEVGRDGDTNGAAMRIAPIGITTPVEPLSSLIDTVEQACRLTHNTAPAIAAAAAVAAAISAGIDGADVEAAIALAVAAAREGAGRGYPSTVTASGMADRIATALAIAHAPDAESLSTEIASRVGTSVASYESVPAAFAILKFAGDDAWKAALICANIGGDTDTIGAMAAGMAGACCGASALPGDKIAMVEQVNRLDLASHVPGLLAIRQQQARRARQPEQAL